MRKLTTKEFIKKAIVIHGDKYDYSKVEYVNSTTKVTIGCDNPEHEDFEQTPDNHLLGQGCKECAGNKKLTTEEFIERAKAIHGDKYDYSKVKYVNSKLKVIIGCDNPEHGWFEQEAKSHYQGHGCDECGRKSSGDSQKSNTKEFINKAIAIHGEKYDYSKVEYVNNHTKVIIGCDNPEHEDFPQTPSAHLDGQGCDVCGGSKELTTEEFIIRAKAIHGDKYDYSKVKYVNYDTKVMIGCNNPEHEDFEQTPHAHLNGHGCKRCVGLQKPTTKEFIEKARAIHGDKYDYSKVEYVNSTTKIIIGCKEHGWFLQEPSSHLCGRGCKKCYDSKGERRIELLLNNFNIKFEQQKTFDDCVGIRKLPFDFYLLDYNLCIEFDGEQHYYPVRFNGRSMEKSEKSFERLKITDQIKTDYCKNNNINLLRIPYTEFKNIEEILQKELNFKINLNS